MRRHRLLGMNAILVPSVAECHSMLEQEAAGVEEEERAPRGMERVEEPAKELMREVEELLR